MNADGPIVIVGGGPAAGAAAMAYREAGGREDVTILAREAHQPYERPPLTKEYLRGESGRDELWVEDHAAYASQAIELVNGVEVTRVDREGRIIESAAGEWSFGACVLATGSSPMVPDVPGVGLDGVRTIRTIEDSDRLRDAAAGSRVLVVGSGFIGCEAAWSLAELGAKVTVMTMEASPQVDRLGEQASEAISSWLESAGIELRTGTELAAIEADGDALSIHAHVGPDVSADLVLLALGISRNDELAGAAGLGVEDGVKVDDAMATEDPRIFAAGDVAFAHNASAGRRLHVEHWGEALTMGEVAGRNLAGEHATWAQAPGFWSSIGDRTLKYVGWGDGYDDVRWEESSDGGFVGRYGRDGVAVGLLAYEADEAYETGRDLIEKGLPFE